MGKKIFAEWDRTKDCRDSRAGWGGCVVDALLECSVVLFDGGVSITAEVVGLQQDPWTVDNYHETWSCLEQLMMAFACDRGAAPSNMDNGTFISALILSCNQHEPQVVRNSRSCCRLP